ncbi:glycosyltransferase [Lacipirellula limnantheis]|uniref:2-deoxystreptamine glucosyltransferase n=1 Tax=Lacipirellula limnantheis TaxID=2528024 RepID=A0A517TYA1_9BACT|nr:glycosyltransferase [Lacipirellula limnantheis]QDT73346.1 2-deoxystreptamine glucosyltransferase [Lacipirellula limnantheis]
MEEYSIGDKLLDSTMAVTTPIKIAIIIDTATLGGPGKGILQFLRHETSGKYSYIVFNFKYRSPRSTQFIDMARDAGCDLRLLPQRFKWDPSAVLHALDIVRSEGVAIVQSHGYKAHAIAQVVTQTLGKPWLAMAHGWTCEDWKVRMYNALERLMLRRADFAGAVSPPLFQELLSLRGTKRPTRLILNAIDPTEIGGQETGAEIRARYGISASACVIGVFGRLSPEKGVLDGLEAFAEVATSSQARLQLMIVGDGQEYGVIKARVCELGLDDRVTLAGYQQEMKGYYEAIDLLMIPSLSEGLPNVLLEAMSFGIPAVSTRVGAISEVIREGENGWIAEPGDYRGLARRIEQALADGNQLSTFGANARRSLHPRFSPQRRAKEFVSIYDELLRSSN